MNSINVAVRIDLLMYSLILNVVMFVYVQAQYRRKEYPERLFQGALFTVSLLIVAEAISWMTGEIGNSAQIPMHYWSNAIYLCFIPLPGCVGLIYLDYRIYGDKELNKKRIKYYMMPMYLSTVSVIYNFIAPGSLFYIDAQNHYHRGFYVYGSAFVMYGFMLVVAIFFYKDKKRMTARIFKAVGLYFTAPIVGIALQMKMYGTTFSMPFHTLGLFFIFLLLERDEMMRDSLTYLYTRHNFEIRLEDKLKRLEAFTLVLVDLNDFKKINDTYGHVEGDKVLQIVSEILLKCTSVEDLVCRYGGDEFIMLIDFQNDIGNQLKKRINRELKKYNNSNDKYDIELSYGQLFVGEDDKLTKEQLIAEVDCRMYSDKQKCKKQKI